MNEKQQVEGIAKFMHYKAYGKDCENVKCELCWCPCKNDAEEFYNEGYRKLPEDSIVLSKEEYEKLKYTWITDSDAYKKGCEEMAEKIFKMLISKLESNQFLSGKRIIMEVDVENLAKQFDVEIEE